MGATKRKTVVAVTVGLAGVLTVAGTIAGVKASQLATIGAAFAAQVTPPERVNAVDVARQQWDSRVSSVGTVAALQGTQVSAEADGVVRAIHFEAGAFVEAGAVLVTLVDNIRAVIAKKAVRAPFSGKVGIRRVSVGDFLSKGAPIVSLQSIDPVYVEFSVPQRRLAALREGLVVTATADAHAGEKFTGEITALEPHVDAATRNMRVQATFENDHGALKPGMFVAVEVALGAPQTVQVIPATAVVHAQQGDSVFVIEPAADAADALVVKQRPVTLGERRGDFVVVENGARAGERVVATGVFKLREGMSVVVDNATAPAFVLSPVPNNG